jgi:hypothetical protein
MEIEITFAIKKPIWVSLIFGGKVAPPVYY